MHEEFSKGVKLFCTCKDLYKKMFYKTIGGIRKIASVIISECLLNDEKFIC